MMQKRAQTTIFIIIGIIIVISGIFFFYTTQEKKSELEPEITIVEEQVPTEFEPIKKYVNDCVYSVSVEGLKKIGQQGGYISFSDAVLNRESFIITQNPTESDVVQFTKDSNLRIPYWWYLKSANNCNGDCKFSSKRPELRQSDNSIEKQLERYIALRFRECINDFETFKQEYKITENGKLNTDVVIGKNDITVIVEYPIIAELQSIKSDIKQFLVRIPINLNNIYELATKITNLEIKHRYLEKHVLNLLVAFSGVDNEKLPPMSDMTFKFGTANSWQESNIEDKVNELLVSYIPLFQVDGTYNYERDIFDTELKQRLYDSTIIPVANATFKDLAAYFTYLDFWPTYFDLNCRGENCIPSSANSIISFFGIQTYRFAYDLSFPVLIELKEPFALNGQGYSFYFFLESNIRNNKPMPADFEPLERATLSERSLLCDVRTSGNITIAVRSADSNKTPLKDSNILYTVVGESCYIGSTEENGLLIEKFPIGIGGTVNILKDSHIGKAIEFDPKVDEKANLNVNLQPIYAKNFIVKKISAIGTYEAQQEPSEIQVAPGNYVADISLMLNERIIIPEKEKCVSKGFLGKECYTIPKVDFGEKSSQGEEMFPEGGLKLNIALTSKDLERYSTIIFYVVSIDIASVPEQNRVIEDIEQMSKIEDYSNIYQLTLQPDFQ
ncbi:hypothetical protein HYW99_00990 [Candidatus Woesearchaeota archaeon]|nr:hypothetical protein [Candidatus Woesearchaeota archaeon]